LCPQRPHLFIRRSIAEALLKPQRSASWLAVQLVVLILLMPLNSALEKSDRKLLCRAPMGQNLQIAATSEQISEIEQLLSQPPQILSKRPRTRLAVLRSLIAGDGGERNAGMDREGLRKLKRELAASGVAQVLEKLRQRVEAKIAKFSRPRHRRGAPRITALSAALTLKQIRAEPIITLASLVLAKDVQVAILAIQPPTRRQSDQVTLLKRTKFLGAVSQIVRESLTPRWTRGAIDDWLREPFQFLPKTNVLPTNQNLHPRSIAPLTIRFGKRWRFLVIAKGPKRKVSATIDRFLNGAPGEVISPGRMSVVSYLEQALYSLRLRLNFRGLLPTFAGLEDEARIWKGRRDSKIAPPFVWHSNERNAVAGLKLSVADFLVRAAGGYMIDLTVNAWRRIRRNETFPIATTPTRPEVKSNKEGGRTRSFFYEPLPGFEIPWTTKAEGEASALKAMLIECRDASRFQYAVRPRNGQRLRLTAPHDILARTKDGNGFVPEVAVVLLPRHTIFPPPEVDLVAIANQTSSMQTRRVKGVRNLTQQGERFLIFRSKFLISAVRQAFTENRYGKYVRGVNGHEHWWMRLLSGPVQGVEFFPESTELFRPPFYFSQKDLNRGSASPDVARWVKEWHARPPLKVSVPDNGWAAGKPSYDADNEFLELLTTFDADFLLREISDVNWKRLQKELAEWNAAVTSLIDAEFFPNNRPDTQKIKRTVHSALAKKASEFSEDLGPWAFETRPNFPASLRTLRRALENAQTLVLAESDPAALVILSHDAILEEWRRFLGGTLRRKLEDATGIQSRGDADEQSDDGESAAETLLGPDIEPIQNLLKGINRSGADGNRVSEFIRLALDGNSRAWFRALESLNQSRGDRLWNAVEKSLKLARKGGRNAESSIAKALNSARH
jgi:hypothetical protein